MTVDVVAVFVFVVLLFAAILMIVDELSHDD